MEKATFGAGCFWCVEAVLQSLKGVEKVSSGYMGGKLEQPTYQQVCSGSTGHAEVVQLSYDPRVLTYEELLEVFWKTHDPTTLNRQGADVGSQYRSVIFFHSQEQQALAEQYKKELEAAEIWDDPIVTAIEPLQTFYPAEAYHHNYYKLHQQEPYCSVVIGPKMEKLKKLFAPKLKT